MTLVRKLTPEDRAQWEALYAAYAEFYCAAQTGEMRARVWSWLHDPLHEEEALVAERDGRLVGLAHFRPFPRPLAASVGGYLDDLFVDEASRSSGVATALIRGVAAEGAAARLVGGPLDHRLRQSTGPAAVRSGGRPHRLAHLRPSPVALRPRRSWASRGGAR